MSIPNHNPEYAFLQSRSLASMSQSTINQASICAQISASCDSTQCYKNCACWPSSACDSSSDPFPIFTLVFAVTGAVFFVILITCLAVCVRKRRIAALAQLRAARAMESRKNLDISMTTYNQDTSFSPFQANTSFNTINPPLDMNTNMHNYINTLPQQDYMYNAALYPPQGYNPMAYQGIDGMNQPGAFSMNFQAKMPNPPIFMQPGVELSYPAYQAGQPVSNNQITM